MKAEHAIASSDREIQIEAMPVSPVFKWVQVKYTWINLDNVVYIEDCDHWLVVYFRLDYGAHLLKPAVRREMGERLHLWGEEAEALRIFLHQHGVSLTPPKPARSRDEW